MALVRTPSACRASNRPSGRIWPPGAVRLGRSGFSQACRHIAPCRAVHGHYHVHSGKPGYPAADAGTRRFPDFGGSRTNPGGYQESSQFEAAQFQLGDHRSLAEVIADLGQHKFIPSFCIGCYRLGRTGKDSWTWRNRASSRKKCAPNALSTFEEYLLDYGTPEAREAGERAIAAALDGMDGRIRKVSEKLLAKCGTAAGTSTVENFLQ